METKIIELKDVLHYYVGCKMFVFPASTISDGWYAKRKESYKEDWGTYDLSIDNIKEALSNKYLPVLRPLSSITEEEAKYIENIVDPENVYDGSQVIDYYKSAPWFEPEQFHYLLSKHFDLFQLIETGQAIDKTKI